MSLVTTRSVTGPVASGIGRGGQASLLLRPKPVDQQAVAHAAIADGQRGHPELLHHGSNDARPRGRSDRLG